METCGKDTINKGQLWSKEHNPRPWCPCNGSRRKTNQASDCCDCNRWHELAVSSRAVRWELHRRGIPWLAFSCIWAVTCLWTPWCQKLKRRDPTAVPCALDSSLKRAHWLYVQSWASEQPRDLFPPRGLESSPESAVGLRERNQGANHSVTAQRGPRVGAGVQTYPRPDALWAERAGSLRGPPAGNRDFTAFDVRQSQKEERRKELKTSVRKSEGQRK